MSDSTRLRIYGIGLSAVIVAATMLSISFYNKAFSDPLQVTVVSERSGLVMDPGNKVKFRGLEIGQVARISKAGDAVLLELDLNREDAARIPANVSAEIRSTTVFGAKFVELIERDNQAEATLADGDRIHAAAVTAEVNTVFKSLGRVLDGVDVGNVNVTMNVLARSLSGQGGDIARLAGKVDAYLTELEPSLPALRRDLRAVAAFARTADAVSPALFEVLDNATATASSITTHREALDRLLVNLRILGVDARRVLGVNAEALLGALEATVPTTSMLKAYSSELPCLLLGLERSRELTGGSLGGKSPGLRVFMSIRSGLPEYTYANDLPQPMKGTGPTCDRLPQLLSQGNRR